MLAYVLCREEDKVILKRCLHAKLKLPVDSDCFKDIALQLHRDPNEVCFQEMSSHYLGRQMCATFLYSRR